MSARRKPRLVPVETPPIRLRIGIGSEEGFTNVDHIDSIYLNDASVDTLYSAFHFHRISQTDRFVFMNDAYRILKPGSQFMLVAPHAFSSRAIADPLAVWPTLCESSFMVYSAKWRAQEGMTETKLAEHGLPPLTCDFGASYGYGHTGHPDLAVRNEEFVAHAKEHEVNWILDLHVTLTKEPSG